MTDYPALRRLAAEQSPLGSDARKVLEELASLRVELARRDAAALETQRQAFLSPPTTPVVNVDPKQARP